MFRTTAENEAQIVMVPERWGCGTAHCARLVGWGAKQKKNKRRVKNHNSFYVLNKGEEDLRCRNALVTGKTSKTTSETETENNG